MLIPFLTITNESEYDAAVERLNTLLDEIGTNEKHPLYTFLDTLGTLIHAYEEHHDPIPDCSGLDILDFLMTEHELTPLDLPKIERKTMKTTSTYWNPLDFLNTEQWKEIDGSEGNLKEITLAIDVETGDYTRLTWFKDGYCTNHFGAKVHPYPEEIFVISGRLYDEAFGIWLEPGYYASRPPGEIHGPFRAEGDVLIYETSFPSQSVGLTIVPEPPVI
ncbi:MAG: cupin domain-containing protein [Prochlorotrichaceae cyanobacterium]